MNFAVKDAANITFYDVKTGNPILYTENANSFEFKLNAETVYAKAKGNKAIAFDGEITCELKIEFEVIQLGHLSMMLASDVVEKSNHKNGQMRKLRLDNLKKCKLLKTTPVSGSVLVFKLASDGQEILEKYTITETTSGQDHEITVTTSSAKEGDIVGVFYQLQSTKIKTITMSTNGKSPNFRIEADVSARTHNGEMMVFHLTIKNAKAKRNAELTLSAENPSKFPIELDCFPDEFGEYAEIAFFEEGAVAMSLKDTVSNLDPDIRIREPK